MNELTIQIIIVTETWLSADIPDDVINIPGFILIRKNRHNGFGRGCAIYVSDEIPMKILNDLSDTNIECQWLTLRSKWLPRSVSRLAIASVYLPPSIDHRDLENFYDYFQTCYDILSTESPDTGFIAAGDFNPCSKSFDANYLTKYCDVNLKQVIKAPTWNSNDLDLNLSNIGIYYNPPEPTVPLSTSGHKMVIWKAKTQHHQNRVKKIDFRPTPSANLQHFSPFLENFNWPTVLNAKHVNDKVEEFIKTFNDMIDSYFPKKTVRLHCEDRFFMTGKIKGLLKKRDRAFKQGRTPTFKSLQKRIAFEIRKAKENDYIRNIQPHRDCNPRVWWKKIWGLSGKNRTLVVLSDPETNLPTNNKDAANTIKKFFPSLTSDFPEVEFKWSGYGHLDILPVVTPESVEKKLSSIKTNKAPGPSDPCLKIVKIFFNSLLQFRWPTSLMRLF